jgi:hypothetical protein
MPPRNLPRWLPILLLLVLVPAVGCGKKSTGPKTIAQQLAEARAIESPEAKARALVRIARRQLKSSDKAGAGKTLAEARGLIKPDADPAVAGQRLVEIADLYAKSDARPVARESLKQGIEMAGRVTDPIAKIRILADAATVSGAKTGGLGDAKAAREALDSATAAAEGVEERFKVQAFAAIAVALAKVGQNAEATKLADRLEEMARGQEDPRAKAEALAAAANVRAEGGDKAKAATLLAEADAAATAISKPENKAYGLLAVAGAFLANGDAAAAVRLLKTAEKEAAKIADPEGQKNALEKVRLMLAEAYRKK